MSKDQFDFAVRSMRTIIVMGIGRKQYSQKEGQAKIKALTEILRSYQVRATDVIEKPPNRRKKKWIQEKL